MHTNLALKLAMLERTLSEACILIVEDSQDLSLVLQLMIEHQLGCRTILAEDGKQAIELAKSQSPSLILMDLVLPQVNGWEAISAIRADDATRDIPIIILSDYCWQLKVREEAQKLGVLACMDKGCFLEHLSPMLKSVLGIIR